MATRARLDPDELAGLEEQRDFLLTSLDDLEREHDAGDLDDHDHQVLHDDYTARAAEVLRAIDQRRQAFADARRPSSTGRIVAVVAGVLAFSVLAGVLVANALGRRQADGSATGGIRSTPSQDAKRCIGRIQPQGDPRPALECFRKVLDRDPGNAVALTYQGWTLNLTAASLPTDVAGKFQADAARLVDRGLRSDPSYPDALAFRAIIAFQQRHFADAKRFLARLDASNPPPEITSLIDQFDLRRRIQAGLRSPSSSGSGPTVAPSAPTTTG